jgi:hypothetical protein
MAFTPTVYNGGNRASNSSTPLTRSYAAGFEDFMTSLLRLEPVPIELNYFLNVAAHMRRR